MNADSPDMSNRPAAADLVTDHRPWGYFVVLEDACDHKVKRIVVHPGRRLSLQRHQHRCEHWVVLTGSALVTLDDRVLPLEPGGTLDISAGQIHRIENTGDIDLEIIEVQRGDYCGEDDIERFEDDFGRC
ncbi:MAG: Alginate biosynthesis protein AlgA [Actinobacteria bacterium ADurb.Bin444]|nr:MAG: Alginate biosynthesis protein AlgA [Actinobacteria bacterium ADurb.Bin444]